jgi:hypothetical protein
MPRQRNRSLFQRFLCVASGKLHLSVEILKRYPASKVFFLLAGLTDAYAATEKPQSFPAVSLSRRLANNNSTTPNPLLEKRRGLFRRIYEMYLVPYSSFSCFFTRK